MRARTSLLVALFAAALACGPRLVGSDEADTTSSNSESSSASESTSVSESDSATSPTVTTYTSNSWDWTSDIVSPPCDVHDQDCPEDEKCVFSGEGTTFVETTCVPILGDQQPGEDCTWGGIEVASDDCAVGSFCVDLDWQDGDPAGECQAYCAESEPACAPEQFCVFWGQDGPAFCEERCNPLVQDCKAGHACHFATTDFSCVPIVDARPAGDPCEFAAQCAGGLLCMSAAALPSCVGDSCCTRLCDIQQPDACLDQPGTTCEPFYDGNAVPGLESLGVCTLPP